MSLSEPASKGNELPNFLEYFPRKQFFFGGLSATKEETVVF